MNVQDLKGQASHIFYEGKRNTQMIIDYHPLLPKRHIEDFILMADCRHGVVKRKKINQSKCTKFKFPPFLETDHVVECVFRRKGTFKRHLILIGNKNVSKWLYGGFKMRNISNSTDLNLSNNSKSNYLYFFRVNTEYKTGRGLATS